jgi:pheromone shutdown protein TraB
MDAAPDPPPAGDDRAAEPPSAARGGPTVEVELDGVSVTLLGTAHVSRASAHEVRERIESGDYDAVAIELDRSRHAALTDPDRMLRTDLFTVFRRGQGGAMAANLALGAFQQRLADQYGIEPGQEMRDAIEATDAAGVPLQLIDRDIGVTLRRVYRSVPWWRRLELMAGLVASVLSREQIDEEEIERLKEGDVLEATFAEFAERSERLYRPLIAERDAFMAARLRQESARLRQESARLRQESARLRQESARLRTDTAAASEGDEPGQPRLLAVVGAGHLRGIAERLRAPVEDDPERVVEKLSEVPPPSPVVRALPWLLVALVVTGFAVGFARDPELGRQLLGDWFWINGVASGVGALAAAAHPLTVVGTVLAAPFTSLNPTVGAGFVAAALELWRRKPSVGDFATLRRDATRLRGWYRNRVARTLLVFLGATLGSALGTYLAGARILTRLF